MRSAAMHRGVPSMQAIAVAILPFSGTPDETYYFNALLDRIHQSPAVREVRTDYVAERAGSFRPDVILSIEPQITYRSSGWNFLINWPGFLLFTPYRWWQRQHSLHHAHTGDLDHRGPGEIHTMTVVEYERSSRLRRLGDRLYRNPRSTTTSTTSAR